MFVDEFGPGPDPTTAVIAHSLISSAAVVSGAIESVITYGDEIGPEKRDELLRVALTQAEYMSEVLKDLARGLSSEVIEALDAIAQRRP